MAEQTKISVVIPVYNEAATIGRVIERVLDCGFDPEIIVVDDASTDGTAKFLREFSHPRVQCFFHAVNRGKGAALRLGFAAAKNPYVFVQDADLEYDPRDYAVMIGPLLDGRADMVYGSRFLSGPHRVMFFWHYVANRAVTLLSDMVSDLNLTDMETGMKGFLREKLMDAQAQRQPLHLRARDNRQGGARAMANLRSAGVVCGTDLRRGQEDRLSRRADGGVRDSVLQIFRLMRSNCNMTQTVQHDDVIHVHPDSNTAAAPALSIAGVDPELGFAGGETQVLGLTIALARSGHRAELICDPAGRLWERAVAAGIRCHPLRIRNAIDVAAGIRLRAILKRERYDVVHFHTSRAHSMAPFARGFARALVVTRRMDYRPNRVFAPYLYNRAVDGVVAISGGVADSLAAAGVDRKRVTVVHSGVDCDRFRSPTARQRADARGALGISHGRVRDIGGWRARAAQGPSLSHRSDRAARAAASSVKVKCFIAGQGSIRARTRTRNRSTRML